MTRLGLAKLVRLYTNTDTNTFTDTNMLLIANSQKDDFAVEITKVDENYFGVPETANLVLNQREYPLPSDMLNHIKQVEITFDGTTWFRIHKLNNTRYRGATDETSITTNFANYEGQCYYDVWRGSLWLYSGSVPALTNALKIWSFEWPFDLPDLTDNTTDLSTDPNSTSAGFPKAFHELLARKISIIYKGMQEKPVPLTDAEKNFQVDFDKKIDGISSLDMSEPILGNLPSKHHTGNNGYNY